MIDKMTKYSFILLSGESEDFLGKLQELGLVDITRSIKPVDEASSAKLDKILKATKAIGILGSLDYSKDEKSAEIEALAANVKIEGCKVENTLAAKEKLDSLAVSIASAEREANALLPWGDYSREAVQGLASQGIRIHYYHVTEKAYDPAWSEQWPVQVVSRDKSGVWFVTVSREGEEYDFPVAELAEPSMSHEEALAKIEGLKSEVIEQKARLLFLKQNYLSHIKEKLEVKTADLDRYLASASAGDAAEGYISTFIGFAPNTEKKKLEKAFDEMGVLYLTEDAVTEDNPPIKLKNNPFVQMFEVFTDMYGRPAYDGFDPTVFISIFFMLFFAMCMGDAGYGLLLIAVGFLLKKKMSDGFGKYGTLVCTLGVATVVIGFLWHTFFSIDISQWGWIQACGLDKIMVPATIAGFDGSMVLAVLIGIVHLCCAMVVKTVYATKNKGFLNSLSIWGWTIFLVGTVVVLAIGGIFHLDSSVTKWIIIGLGILGAIGIFPLRTIGKNPLINIGGGLWETYNTATGLLGDVLSYLRLYALGLAGAMLGQAFNTLAVMTLGDGGLGWIPFILIALIGHTLNIAMCALGAFVHPLRLNFLEFFKNSDYDGSGRNYKPLKK